MSDDYYDGDDYREDNHSDYSDESDDWRDDHTDSDDGYDQHDDGYEEYDDWQDDEYDQQDDEDYYESGEAYDYEPEEYRAEGLDEVADEIGYSEPDTANDDHKDKGHSGNNHWMTAIIAAIMGYTAGRSRAASRRQRTAHDGTDGINRQNAKGQIKDVNSGCSDIIINIVGITIIILLLKSC